MSYCFQSVPIPNPSRQLLLWFFSHHTLVLPALELHINGIMLYLFLWVWIFWIWMFLRYMSNCVSWGLWETDRQDWMCKKNMETLAKEKEKGVHIGREIFQSFMWVWHLWWKRGFKGDWIGRASDYRAALRKFQTEGCGVLKSELPTKVDPRSPALHLLCPVIC